jgi:uncharacterized protein (TIGR02271 family)
MIDTADIDALSNATVQDRDGDRLGTVRQVYLSEDGGRPLFVTVHTGLFGHKESFVPLQDAQLSGGVLRIAYDKDTVKEAPKVDADGAISDDEQGTIFDYYDGRAGGSASGVGGTPAGLETDAGTTGRHSSTGYDTSGPTTDDAMTRSEERLNVGTQQVQTGRARLRKHVVTEQQNVTVPVSREEVRIEREPITDANRDAAYDGPDLSDEEHEVVLTEERPVVEKETVPVERVRLSKDQVTENQNVSEDVRREEIDMDGDGSTGRTA